MIISGFTQRDRDVEDLVAGHPDRHSHCVRCRKVTCTQFADYVTACVMGTCELCGWRCHECKMSEHLLTCPEMRVQCVNKEYGCPNMLKRCQMAKHLPVCPASVVCCVEEWNRWPMHVKDKGKRLSLPQTKTYIDCGQLDVSLAMRDQRMLIDALRAPRKLRRTLRNQLTQKYPAVPFPHRSPSTDSDMATSEDTSQTVSDDETDAPWDLTKSHPGLQESIHSRLFRMSKETTDSLAAALESARDVPSSTVGDGGDAKGEEFAVGSNCLTTESNLEAFSPLGVSTDSCSHSLHDSSSRLRGSPSVERSLRSSVSTDRSSDVSTRSRSVLRDIGGTQFHRLTGSSGPEDAQSANIHLHKLLGVNINYECINKYTMKPRSMYSFVCAQNFRRDQYRWHFKNVHMEIHQGFCSWLEQRCPLAYLGCTFSFNRMVPAQPDATLYHSWLLESFGVRSNAQPLVTSNIAVSCDSQHISRPESDSRSIPWTGGTDHHQHTSLPVCMAHNEASIADLTKIHRDYDSRSTPHPDDNIGRGLNEADSSENVTDLTENFKIAISYNSEPLAKDGPESNSNCVRVRPLVYTACNWDSKVLFQYDLEEEVEEDSHVHSLINLPFELLRSIAKHLDSFSLCNLALTCHTLRDVCCSLLEEHGIVILEWEKQCKGDEKLWRVSSKRWMFSTSFEPIRSWKFCDDHPTIGDHLRICPYNQDVVRHTGPVPVMLQALDGDTKIT